MERQVETSTEAISMNHLRIAPRFPNDGISLWEYMGEDWRFHFTKEHNLRDLLRQLEIPFHDDYRVGSRRLIGRNRCQAILVKEGSEQEVPTKILVDVKRGDPTWEQFIDVTYCVDKDINTRIILYDDRYSDQNRDDPPGDSYILRNLVGQNNRCGVDTYQAQVYCPREKNETNRIQYLLDTLSRGENVSGAETLPSREQIERAEFWVEYYLPRHPFGHHVVYDEEIGDCLAMVRFIGNIYESRVTWTNDGIFVSLSCNSNDVDLREIWEKIEPHLIKEYPELIVEFQEKEGIPTSVQMKIANVSIQDCGMLSPSTKKHIAHVIVIGEGAFGPPLFEVFGVE